MRIFVLSFTHNDSHTQILKVMMIKVTPEVEKRIKVALYETILLMQKELSYSEHLQKKNMIESYESHICFLQKSLKDGYIETSKH